MKRGFIALAALICVTAVAQQTKPAEPVKPPVISDKMQKDYFKAQSEVQAAQHQSEQIGQVVQQKQAALQAVIKDITAACGTGFHPEVNTAGDLVCVATPEPTMAPEKK